MLIKDQTNLQMVDRISIPTHHQQMQSKNCKNHRNDEKPPHLNTGETLKSNIYIRLKFHAKYVCFLNAFAYYVLA